MNISLHNLLYVLLITSSRLFSLSDDKNLYLDDYELVIFDIESSEGISTDGINTDGKYRIPRILSIVALTEDLNLQATHGNGEIRIPKNNISFVFFDADTSQEASEMAKKLKTVDFLKIVEKDVGKYNAKFFSSGSELVLKYYSDVKAFRVILNDKLWLKVGTSSWKNVIVQIMITIEDLDADDKGGINSFKGATFIAWVTGKGVEFSEHTPTFINAETEREKVIEISKVYKRILDTLIRNFRLKVIGGISIGVLVLGIILCVIFFYYRGNKKRLRDK